MVECNCIIGLLVDDYHTTLVTEGMLKYYKGNNKPKELTKFNFCPFCSKRIDWERIEENAEQ